MRLVVIVGSSAPSIAAYIGQTGLHTLYYRTRLGGGLGFILVNVEGLLNQPFLYVDGGIVEGIEEIVQLFLRGALDGDIAP